MKQMRNYPRPWVDWPFIAGSRRSLIVVKLKLRLRLFSLSLARSLS